MSRCHDASCGVLCSHLDAKAAGHMSLAHNQPVVDHSPADFADGLRHRSLVVLDTVPGFGSHLAGSVVRTGSGLGLGRMTDPAGRIRLDRRVRTFWMDMESREDYWDSKNAERRRVWGVVLVEFGMKV